MPVHRFAIVVSMASICWGIVNFSSMFAFFFLAKSVSGFRISLRCCSNSDQAVGSMPSGNVQSLVIYVTL